MWAPGAGKPVTRAALWWRGQWTQPVLKNRYRTERFKRPYIYPGEENPHQGAKNPKDAPIKCVVGGWADWTDVTKTLQWYKHPEEYEQINIEWGDGKNPNNQTNQTGWL